MYTFNGGTLKSYKIRPIHMKRIKAFLKKVLFWTIIPAGVMLGVYFLFFHSSTVEFHAPKVIENEVIKEINPLDPQYEKRQAELEDRYRQIANLEAQIQVNKTEIERLNAKNVELTAELADFMTATASGE